jgi:hypothetical protein
MNNDTLEQKTLIGLELLNTLNAEGCPACGRKITLGETAIAACGTWQGGLKYIHEAEAIYDKASTCYFERGYYKSRR